jgi:2,3-dihydroxyphenylpropionate 1,2-dioxygenase
MTVAAASRAFLGMSHTPLLGLNPVAPDVESSLRDALDATSQAVRAWRPDRVVLFGPDHYNGFFNELMPPFCIGTQAESVGDYTTLPGPLHVPADEAVALADWLMDHDFDMAVSRRMKVDHGMAQALGVLWGSLDTPPVIPVFVNAVAAPGIPRVRRCVALGRAVGAWLDTLPGRTLVVGSGGLSHEPPVPTLDHPDAGVRERITVKWTPTQAERDAKTQRVMAAGVALAKGDPSIKPLAPEWDARWMAAIESGDLDRLCGMDEAAITRDAGLSAHESKTWAIARAAVPGAVGDAGRNGPPALKVGLRYYRAIPAYVAGFGVLWMPPAAD